MTISYTWGLPPLLGVLFGLVGGIVGGLFMTYVVSYRLVGMYLAIATFAFNEALAVVWRNVEFVGGTLGVVGIPLIDEVLPVHIWAPIDDLWDPDHRHRADIVLPVALREVVSSAAASAPPSTTSASPRRWASTCARSSCCHG